MPCPDQDLNLLSQSIGKEHAFVSNQVDKEEVSHVGNLWFFLPMAILLYLFTKESVYFLVS